MSVNFGDPKLVTKAALLVLAMMTAGYLLFLIGTWLQFQHDRSLRDEKIDKLLDNLPPRNMNASNSEHAE